MRKKENDEQILLQHMSHFASIVLDLNTMHFFYTILPLLLFDSKFEFPPLVRPPESLVRFPIPSFIRYDFLRFLHRRVDEAFPPVGEDRQSRDRASV